jgi:hypothetical protein
MVLSDFEDRTSQFVLAMVDACRGDSQRRLQVSALVGRMSQDESTLPLAVVLSRIIAGERAAAPLLEGLEGEPAALVRAVLLELDKW